jgi:hypothetical protein
MVAIEAARCAQQTNGARLRQKIDVRRAADACRALSVFLANNRCCNGKPAVIIQRNVAESAVSGAHATRQTGAFESRVGSGRAAPEVLAMLEDDFAISADIH